MNTAGPFFESLLFHWTEQKQQYGIVQLMNNIQNYSKSKDIRPKLELPEICCTWASFATNLGWQVRFGEFSLYLGEQESCQEAYELKKHPDALAI